MKPIATGIYTFEKLIGNGCVYVDKTNHFRKLIESLSDCQYFIARPRRFGKSLALSTLQAIFECRRELFKALAIDNGDYEWEPFPVIRLDMSTTAAETVEEFNRNVNLLLRENARRLGVDIPFEDSAKNNFQMLIDAVAGSVRAGQIVLLVDEYDKPLLGHLCTEKVEVFKTALKQFYSVIKATEGLQRFTFITGVSKFSKVSIFSDLNNLTDLTMRADTATLFGYTHEEVKRYFSDHIAALAQATNLTPEQAFENIIAMYDGYCFEENSERVVNPVSLGKCLNEQKFDSYWYETGTPTFLVELLKRNPVNVSGLELDKALLGAYEPSNPEIETLLFQTGYLTIQSSERFEDLTVFKLDFPNKEVRNAFNSSLMPAYTGCTNNELKKAQGQCIRALNANNLQDFFEAMKVFYAGIPYDLTAGGGERIWQTIMFTVLRFIGVGIQTEVETNRGRIDAVIKTAHDIYVIEVKLDQPSDAAIAQIRANGYADKYSADGRAITLIGICFSSAKRDIAEWKSEPL